MKYKYRRRRGSDTWHFVGTCSNWPTSDFIEREDKPKKGELCNECRARAGRW